MDITSRTGTLPPSRDVHAGSREWAKVDAGGLTKRKGAAFKSDRLEIVFAMVEVNVLLADGD